MPGCPVVSIPHGVSLPDVFRLRLLERSRERFRIAYLGRIVELHKQVLRLPDILGSAIARGVDAQLAVLGDGPDRCSLEDAFRRGGLADRVEWFGAVASEEVYPLLMNAHALLLPSSSEGFPFAPLEAQACGCVPVATCLPGATDAEVEDGRTGFLIPRSASIGEFASRIESLDRDRDRWISMARAGHERIAQRFSVEAMGAGYRKLLEDGWAGLYPLARSRRAGPELSRSLTWRDRLPEGLRRAARKLAAASIASPPERP
jgi:glycosyltransferase involved in cell wall biosynthesis